MRNVFASMLLVATIAMGVYAQGQVDLPDRESTFRKLSDTNANVMERLDAAKILSNMRDERALDCLLEFLKDEDRRVHVEAIRHIRLYWKGNKRIVEPVIKALNNKDSFTRRLAASCLGNELDKRAIEPLIGKLTDKDEKVRNSVALALCRITFFNFNKGFSYKDRNLMREDIEEDADKWRDWWSRNKKSIDEIMVSRRIDVLKNKKEEMETRLIAVEDLVRLEMVDEIWDFVIEILGDNTQSKNARSRVLIVAVEAKQTEKIVPTCLKIARDRSENVRIRRLAAAMLVIDEKEVVDVLTGILMDRNEDLPLRRVAGGSLAAISATNDRALDVVNNVMKDESTDKSIRYWIKEVQERQKK